MKQITQETHQEEFRVNVPRFIKVWLMNQLDLRQIHTVIVWLQDVSRELRENIDRLSIDDLGLRKNSNI